MKPKLFSLLILVLCLIVGRTEVAIGEEQAVGDAQLPLVFLNTTYTPNTGGNTYTPSNSTEFQAALNSSQLGDTIVLQAGALYSGNFTLPKKTTGTGWIIIRTSNLGGISAPQARINPTTQAAAMPKIETTIDFPAIQTAPGAHHYRLIGLEIRLASSVTRVTNGLVELGNGDESDVNLPSDIIIDRCYVHGLDSAELKRGVQLNGKNSSVIDSYISKCSAPTIETQGISGWNGPGPFKVVNNYIEASGENLFFGGSEIVQNRVPSDIEIRNNHLYKPPSWRHNKLVKNLFELKNARRVLFDGNLLEHTWAWEEGDPCGNNVCDASGRGQIGIAVLFTPRNESSNNATWTVVEDVTFRNNIVRHATGVFRILGYDDSHTTQQTKRITITNNLFEDINSSKWGTADGNTRAELFFPVGKDNFPGPADVHITHNTGFVSGNLADIIWGPDACTGSQTVPGFIFTDNIFAHNSNSAQAGGVTGGCRGIGNVALNTFFPGATFTRNVLMGGSPALYSQYPGNYFPSDWATVRFVNMAIGNYNLAPNSPYKNLDPNGNKDLGVNTSLLPVITPYTLLTPPVRLNAGGPQYVDSASTLWLADDYYLAGYVAAPSNVSTANILNTTADTLYRSERYGGNPNVNPVSYVIPVQNGSYTVRLHFAEIYWCVSTNPCPNNGSGPGIGARVFNVNIESTPSLTNYDIIARTGGALRAIVEEVQANVSDGILNIDLTAISDNAKISAIEVIPPPNTGFWTNVVGATVNGNNLTKPTNGTAGWNAGATSVQSLSGDGYAQFSTSDNTTNKMAGLNSNHSGQNYTEIDYAINLSPSGNVRIFENGASVTNPATQTFIFGTYIAGDQFRLAVENGMVKYYQNATLLYTSSILPMHPLVLDTSLNTPGATITNASIVAGATNVVWTNVVGATANGNDLTKPTTGAAGWNAGATSVQTLSGDGYVEFSTSEANTLKMAGLNANPSSNNYVEIDYAIALSATTNVRIYENGVAINNPATNTVFFGTYAAGDIFRVAIENGAVKYYQNGTLLYTSSALPNYPLVLDVSLNTPGATITDAKIAGSN